jgi:hypothetical protein
MKLLDATVRWTLIIAIPVFAAVTLICGVLMFYQPAGGVDAAMTRFLNAGLWLFGAAAMLVALTALERIAKAIEAAPAATAAAIRTATTKTKGGE